MGSGTGVRLRGAVQRALSPRGSWRGRHPSPPPEEQGGWKADGPLQGSPGYSDVTVKPHSVFT